MTNIEIFSSLTEEQQQKLLKINDNYEQYIIDNLSRNENVFFEDTIGENLEHAHDWDIKDYAIDNISYTLQDIFELIDEKLNGAQTKALLEGYADFLAPQNVQFKVKTLEDEYKIEIIEKLYNTLSLQQLEKLI